MTTRDEADRDRVARTENWILVGYCFFVFGGLAGAAGFFSWLCANC